MGRPLSMDLRRRVVAAIEGGLSTGEAARRFSVSKAAAGAWARLKHATGDVVPKKQGGPAGSMLDAHEGFILELIAARKDITLVEISEQLMAARGVRAVPSTIWYFLDDRDLTFKKNRARERAGPARREGAAARLAHEPA